MRGNAKASAKAKNAIHESQYIVGIGASAGGLEALQSLLSALPADLGFPYVIIQHLSPDYKSLLSDILGKDSDMPVVQATDGTLARPNCIYIIPPARSIRYENGVLRLSEQESGALHLPVDIFFKSIAEAAGPKAIGIVLSGTGSDGTNGIKQIKENDGMVIVQSPISCKFDGMPKSAIRTGLVDVQGTPEEIAAELEHIAEVAKKGPALLATEKEIDDALMERIYYILRKVSNVNFTHYKKATLLRRVERRMILAHADSFADYVDLLYVVPDEARMLSREVLIGVTNFFREPEYFDCLQKKAIVPILMRGSPEEPVRAWVAGCSTGEEAYSIAILFCEAMEQLKIKREIKIFATDLDAEAITTAGKGVFGSNIAASVSAARLSKYFTRKDNAYVINRDVRKMLVFAPHNVVQDPPFGNLDLISCRNLIIYFQPVLQRDLFGIFHVALKDGGFLFLGKSEAVGTYTKVFPVVDAAAKLFTHRSDIKIKGAKPIPHLQTMTEDIDGPDDEAVARVYGANAAQTSESPEQLSINTVLLERFMPACLVVNSANCLVYVYGDCKQYVSVPVGRVTNALFDLLEEPLRIPVSTALRESREKEKMVQYSDIHFAGREENITINLTVTPISKKSSGENSLYALIFSEMKNSVELPDAVPYDLDHMAAQRITDLEQELSSVHSQLTKSVSEQETVNEELQASNEELLTANEELQSSNEELQSVNEELYTVNSEYQLKMSELATLNDDITNFLATTLIGIIFVDSNLCLRRYTNYVTTEFNVLDQDIGRSIDFLSYQFTGMNLAQECKRVIEALSPDEREVGTNRGKRFFVRVAPFLTTENKVLGCVITFVDVTAQRQEQEKLKQAEDQLSLAQQASKAKSDFLSRMSHEIRTPMNTVAGLAEMVEAQIDDKDALRKIAQNLRETVNYMTSIVSDILELSRIERAQIELEAKPLVLRDVVQRVISMIEPRMAENGLTFSIAISEKFAPIYIGDTTRIQQILMNILTNATKYTPRGGSVKFQAYVQEQDAQRDTVCFVVSDNGIGISQDFLQEIFNPFSRENRNDKNASNSMGLGLPIADSLAKLMGGDIAVQSVQGEGTTFTVTLKLIVANRNAPGSANASPEGRRYALSGCNVLIAEDNAMNRTILEGLLSRSGVTFTSVGDGEAAVAAFAASPENAFNCILMDMRMPKMGGLEAAARIRKSARADARTVPIVALSANAFSEDVQQAREAGINDYLTKPIDTGKLFALLQKYWSGSAGKYQ